MPTDSENVCFSNRPFGVKHFQTIHHCGVGVARRRVLLFGIGTKALELPEAGVTYYDVPQEYGVRDYRYTIVNDRPVLVDPRTRRIVEVVE
jgi:hypothetical protein